MFSQRLRASFVLSLGLGAFGAVLTSCSVEAVPAPVEETAATEDTTPAGGAPVESALEETSPTENSPVEAAAPNPAPAPAEPSPTTAVATSSGPLDTKTLLGDPIFVNGQKIGLDEIKRTSVLVCEMGRALFELGKIQVYIDTEIARQIKEDGKSPADFEVGEEEFGSVLERHKAGVAAQFTDQEGVNLNTFAPTEDPVWVGNMKQTILFKKVFLPENPHEFPPITVEAFSQNTQNDQNLYTVLCDDYDNAQELGTQDDQAKSTDAARRVFELMQTQTLINFLKKNAKIQEIEAGLEPRLLAIVDETEVTVDEIWDVIVKHKKVGPADVRRAKEWLVNTTLLEQGLAKAGTLLTVEEAAEVYEEQTGKYRDGGFSYEALALSIKRYPTIGMYKAHHRLYESLRRMVQDEMTDEVLTQQGVDRTAMILSLAPVDADVILLSAFNFRDKVWKENGWADAEAKAKEVAKKLAAGEDWNKLLDEYSEFWDLPLPTARLHEADNDPKRKNGGRFRNKSRNPFANALEEPEFIEFLALNSITDTIFFDMEVGQIAGPFKGPHGYYIPKLLHRNAATTHLTPSDDRNRTFLQQDYLTCKMRTWTRELMDQAEITGW